MDLKLQDKVVLVAGGTAGIGAATARLMAAEGAKLAVAARGRPALDALAAELPGTLAVQADLSAAGAADSAIQATVDRFGGIDVLVVSIGAAQGGLFWDLADEVWEHAIALKLMGVVRLLRAAAPLMKAQGSGAIVVVVGANGHQPDAALAPGSAVNAACLAVVKSLANELAPHGVRVNAVNPGPTRTGRWDNLIRNLAAASGRSAAAEEQGRLAAVPVGRISEPEEIARMIALIASETMPTLTGTSVTVDGGATRSLA